MLRDQAHETLGSEAQGDDDAVEAYVRREFEHNYGISLYENANGDEASHGEE